ncbi:hypothetical protein ACHAXN_001115 [Cyclotella atomus]
MNRWCQSVNDPLNCLCRLSNTTLSLIDDSDNLIVSKTIGDTCGQLTLEYVFEAALQFCQKISTMSEAASPSLQPAQAPSEWMGRGRRLRSHPKKC